MKRRPISRLQSMFRSGVGSVADILFPPACGLCGSPGLIAADGVCVPCEADIARLGQTAFCPTCARTVPPFAVSDDRCHRCRDRKMQTAGVVRAGPYTDPFGAAVRAFKYRRRWPLGAYLARRLADRVERAPWLASVEGLVTVPPWWLRRLGRGEYLPEVLTRFVSRHVGLTRVPALRRIRGGPPQVGLTEAERVRNVRGKFAPAPGVRVEGATLCLIDDVMTTGATVGECARVLRRAGAKAVYVAVAAHADRDEPLVPAQRPGNGGVHPADGCRVRAGTATAVREKA